MSNAKLRMPNENALFVEVEDRLLDVVLIVGGGYPYIKRGDPSFQADQPPREETQHCGHGQRDDPREQDGCRHHKHDYQQDQACLVKCGGVVLFIITLEAGTFLWLCGSPK